MNNKSKVSNLDIHCLKNNRISGKSKNVGNTKKVQIEENSKSNSSINSSKINENDIRQIGKNSLLEKYKKQKIEYSNIMKQYENQKQEQANLIKEYEQQKQEQKKVIEEYENQKQEQVNLIKEYENQNNKQADLIKKYLENNKEKESIINEYEKQKQEQTDTIKEYEKQKSEQENLIKEFEQKNQEKEELIKKYQKQIEEYEKINKETNEQLKKIKAKENLKIEKNRTYEKIRLAKIKQKEEMQELKLTRKTDKSASDRKQKNVRYRYNSRGEKRRIVVSIPVVSLVLFAILIYLLGNEIYSTYKRENIDDIIVDFNKQVAQNVEIENSDSNNSNNSEIGSYIEENGETDSEDSNLSNNLQNYNIIANLKIPSLGIEYPVLSETTDELLKVSITKYWGPEPNEVGNLVILGHNYQTNKFFSKLNQIQMGEMIELTDLSNRTLRYTVYQTQIIDPNDNSCTSQLTDGRTELTLITCYNNDANRFVVKARVE